MPGFDPPVIPPKPQVDRSRRATVDTFSRDVKAVETDIRTLEEERQRLRRKWDMEKAQQAATERDSHQQLTNLQTRIRYKQNELSQKEVECQRLSTAVQSKEVELRAVTLRVQATREMETRAAAVQLQVQESEQKLAQMNRSHQDLQNAKQTLLQTISRLQADHDEKAARAATLDKQLAELTWKRKKTAEAHAKHIEDQENEARATLRAQAATRLAETRLQSLQQQVQEREQKLTQMRRAQQELQNAKQTLSQTFSRLQADHDEKAARTATIEKQLVALEKTMGDKKSRLLALDLEVQDRVTTLTLLQQASAFQPRV